MNEQVSDKYTIMYLKLYSNSGTWDTKINKMFVLIIRSTKNIQLIKKKERQVGKNGGEIST